jgi:hypothetical protein
MFWQRNIQPNRYQQVRKDRDNDNDSQNGLRMKKQNDNERKKI